MAAPTPNTQPAGNTEGIPNAADNQGQPGSQEVAPKPAPPAAKTYTEDEINTRVGQVVSQRLAQDREKLAKQFAGLLGIEGGEVDPAEALKAAQEEAQTARKQANGAYAEALAGQAGIKPERVATFARLLDVDTALANVDAKDPAAVRAAIKAAVDTEAANYPEWMVKAVPAASGGDRAGGGGGEVTVEQFRTMPYGDRVALFERDPNLFERLSDQL